MKESSKYTLCWIDACSNAMPTYYLEFPLGEPGFIGNYLAPARLHKWPNHWSSVIIGV